MQYIYLCQIHYTIVGLRNVENGIHVIVEKSLTCSVSETEELVNLANENNLILVENFQFIHHIQQAYYKLLKNNHIGEIRCLKAEFGFPPFSDKKNKGIIALGGGALLDAGAYPIRIIQELLGQELDVSASSLEFDDNHGVDIWGSGLIKKKNSNITAFLSFGFDNFYQNSIQIWGSTGKISTDRIFTAPPDYGLK